MWREAWALASGVVRFAAARSARTPRRGIVAAVELAERELDHRTVRAPISGVVLQVNVHPGEFARAGAEQALAVMGKLEPLHVRVEIDEIDISRWQPAAAATASPRGESRRRLQLSFVRREPLVVPKRSLTGAADERVDTRVMQVVYSIERSEPTVLPGQLVDVFITGDDVDTIPDTPDAGTATVGAANLIQ